MVRSANVLRATLIALVAQLLVLVPHGPNSIAAPASITYNNQVCDLSTAGYLGSGSSGNPYQISNSESLWEISDCSVTASAAAYFVLTKTIDVSTATTAPTNSPIGYTNSTALSFSGVLDGNGFSIINNQMLADHGVGLFALLQNAVIKNLTIDGSFETYTGGVEVTDSAGALAVQSIGSVTIEAVTNSADVRGYANVSGFIGYHSNTGNDYETLLTFSSSVNLGTIHGQASPVGGFLGETSDTLHIYFSKNLGDVTGVGTDVGGFVGRISSNSTVISASSNLGAVESNSTFAGGLVGRALSSLQIGSSFNTGPVESCNYSGGLVASAQTLKIIDSYNEGAIYSGSCAPGSGTAGGLVAEVQASLLIERAFNSGNVQGEGDLVGGVAASAQTFTLSSAIDIYNSGTISGWGAFGFKGGLFGTADSNLRIERGYHAGRIQGSGIHDGVAGNGSPTVLSTFTVEASRFVGTSTIPKLRSARTFTSWDFAETWGFGTCTENRGLPLLRFAEQRTTYLTEVCQGKLLLEFAAEYESTLSIQVPITNLAAGASLQILGQDLEAISDPMALSDNQVITLSAASVSSEVIYFEISVSSSVFTLGAATNPESWTTSLRAIHAWGALGPSTISNAIRGANISYVPADIPNEVTNLDNFFSGQLDFNGDIGGWDTSRITSAANLFYNARSFNRDIGNWDVSSIQNFSGMFWGAEVFNQDLGFWTVSAATNMANMFDRAHAFNQNISDWDVSNVTNMSLMFWNADAFNQPIGNWVTNGVVNMQEMFLGAQSFNQDLSAWDVSNVTNMAGMFQGATVFNQNLSFWVVSNVTNMTSMFSGDRDGDPTIFNNGGSPGLDNWNVSSATNMSYMFAWNSDFSQNLNSWNTSNVTNMSHMFHIATSFNGQIGSWNTSNVTNMSHMFTSTPFNRNISLWATSKVIDMSRMFYSANSFNQNISGWNVSSVSDMSGMFEGATNFNQNIGGWDVSNVTSMSAMFYAASSFNQNLNSWDTSNVTDMSSMFGYASSFNSPIATWDVSRVRDMSNMFNYATSFSQPLSTWVTSSVLDFSEMFSRASSFNQPLNNWNIGSATNLSRMFLEATSFNQNLNSWDTSNVEYMDDMFLGASSFDQALRWDLSLATDLEDMFSRSGLSCLNYDIFLASASSTIKTGSGTNRLGGASYTPAALADRSAITARGWVISDSPCVIAPSLSGSNINKRTGETISFVPTNSGGSATFTITPSLPAGLTFSAATGAITGQLSSTYSASHVITATNASGTSNITVSIQVTLSSSSNDSSNSSTVPVRTPARPLPLFDSLSKVIVPANTSSSIEITGMRLDQIRAVAIMGRSLTISAQSSSSIKLDIPAISPGVFDLNFALSEGTLQVSAALHFVASPQRLSTSNTLVVLVNKFSSWLSLDARALISSWLPPTNQVVCIAYNDRPGIAARNKAISRATQACRFVGIGSSTRIFVYGKAGSLANTVKLISR